MANDARKTLPIQVKVTPNAKEKIGQRAKAAGLNISEYIRVAAISEKKLYFLTEAAALRNRLLR